jgi:2-polyprenyl-3-methyl-5-hydroxy-6-metoxy-1,4-benzoquinol methylase
MKRSNSSRFWLNIELGRFSSTVPAGHRVLDAGSGDQRYSRLFQHCQYESADFEQVDKRYSPSTYVCDLSAIPVEDGRYDFVIFTQVMEHLPDPDGVVSLMH